MVTSRVIVYDNEFKKFQQHFKENLIRYIASAGAASITDVVNRARANAMSVLKSDTGALVNSINILSIVFAGPSVVEITIGSDLPGYPFWQEMGWTSSSGKSIPGKFFMSAAVYSTFDKVGADISATLREKFANPVNIAVGGMTTMTGGKL